MKKVFFLIVIFCLLVLYFLKIHSPLIPVFNLTNQPEVISKGYYGHTFIIEVSFSHEGFKEWLENLPEPYPLLLLDSDWIGRSTELIQTIEEKRIPTALLGKANKDYEDLKLLSREVAIYEKAFNRKPLWFMTNDYKFSGELKQVAFADKMNMLSPNVLWHPHLIITKGMLISVPLHENSYISFEKLTAFMKQFPNHPIEENILGYSLKQKKLPNDE